MAFEIAKAGWLFRESMYETSIFVKLKILFYKNSYAVIKNC